jgi:PAS domain S-box-containing protein
MNQRTDDTNQLTDDRAYRLLVESVADYAIYMLNPEGIVSTWNLGAQRLKGYEAAEIMGRHFSEFYTPEDREAGLPARALQCAARHGGYQSEGWRLRKDGSRFWAHVVIAPIRTPSGELAGFSKVTRDLTERRQREDALRQSEEQLRLLVQSVTDYAIYRLNPEGLISSWNVGAQRIKGYLPEEVIGTHFSRFYTEEDRARGEPQRALETAAREGRYEKEALRVRKDGSSFWANVVIDPVWSEDGALLGFAKITRDITEQRAARKALEEAREALFQAQKMDAIGQLTGGVAHDFNNLLMAILASLHLLTKRLPADDAKLKSLIDNAIAGVRRGTALTQRMLAFARRQELHVEAVDIATLVHGMAELLDQALGPTVGIDMRFPLRLPAVQTDPHQLELALLNLVVNARDAMPAGGTIVITAREAEPPAAGLSPGRYVCLSVSDKGEGMDAATLARATEPFFTTKGVGKGTGLGLPMVHGVARQSGGGLVLKSEKGQGTTAELWLPAATASVPKAERPVVEPPPERSMPPLVAIAVDDDSLVLRNTAAMLEDLGHRVFEAESGKRALEILTNEAHVDLLITDQVMPGMTGAELAGIVRERSPDLAIILATGYAETPAGIAEGVIRLSKPYDQHDLDRAIHAAVDRRKISPGVLAFRKR